MCKYYEILLVSRIACVSSTDIYRKRNLAYGNFAFKTLTPDIFRNRIVILYSSLIIVSLTLIFCILLTFYRSSCRNTVLYVYVNKYWTMMVMMMMVGCTDLGFTVEDALEEDCVVLVLMDAKGP